ncbi:DUF6090 family protein [Muriicola sp. Z0-33]|uniref:DUF6090 family protein n=1 Tax=Muriicola sp. Z0-33 TaxID=2816957 RepID=UPI002237E89E|nr:DUF6090 family protein [Muriicola sp. Z0-33]MCW5514742.1 hypothetical protein [Muriicola sp. Z0-33]
MISFFRKIRRKLFDGNKPFKYLRYALGEILLVVIGILIALQINNWNEENNERTEEIFFIKSYLVDLEKDRSVMQRNAEFGKITILGADSLSIELEKRPLKGRERKLYHFLALQNTGFGVPHHDRTMTQLKYSGKFSVIENQNVVDALIDYDAGLIELMKFSGSQFKWDIANNTLIDIAKVFDLTIAHQYEAASQKNMEDVNKVNYPADLRLLSYDDNDIMHLRNTLVQGRTLDDMLLKGNNMMLKMNVSLDSLIRSEYFD